MNSKAFMTHNGLKVRLNHDYCLTYLEEDKILPWYISIEAFDSLRGFLAILTLIILMLTHQEPIYGGLTILGAYLVGFFISQSFFEMAILNLVYGFFYMIYSIVSRFFIDYIVAVIIAIISGEYLLLLAFIVVRVISYILISIINLFRGKFFIKMHGVYLGDVEITAIKLLKFYAKDNIKIKKWIQNYSEFINKDASCQNA